MASQGATFNHESAGHPRRCVLVWSWHSSSGRRPSGFRAGLTLRGCVRWANDANLLSEEVGPVVTAPAAQRSQHAPLGFNPPAAFRQFGPMAQPFAKLAALDGRQLVEVLGFQDREQVAKGPPGPSNRPRQPSGADHRTAPCGASPASGVWSARLPVCRHRPYTSRAANYRMGGQLAGESCRRFLFPRLTASHRVSIHLGFCVSVYIMI